MDVCGRPGGKILTESDVADGTDKHGEQNLSTKRIKQ